MALLVHISNELKKPVKALALEHDTTLKSIVEVIFTILSDSKHPKHSVLFQIIKDHAMVPVNTEEPDENTDSSGVHIGRRGRTS